MYFPSHHRRWQHYDSNALLLGHLIEAGAMGRQTIEDDLASMYIHVHGWPPLGLLIGLNRSRRTGYGVVYLHLIRLVSSHKWQACRIEGAIAIMHVQS